jgi:hypothetical protein
LIVQLTREEVDQYLEDRRQKGVNTVLVNLIEHEFADNPPRNRYGQGPFNVAGDFGTPNESYFQHVDYVIAEAAEKVGIPTLSIWASVPHYVHNAPSPEAVLALIDKLEETIDVVIPRGTSSPRQRSGRAASTRWPRRREMAAYIPARAGDTVDSRASGERLSRTLPAQAQDGADATAGRRPARPRRARP